MGLDKERRDLEWSHWCAPRSAYVLLLCMEISVAVRKMKLVVRYGRGIMQQCFHSGSVSRLRHSGAHGVYGIGSCCDSYIATRCPNVVAWRGSLAQSDLMASCRCGARSHAGGAGHPAAGGDDWPGSAYALAAAVSLGYGSGPFVAACGLAACANLWQRRLVFAKGNPCAVSCQHCCCKRPRQMDGTNCSVSHGPTNGAGMASERRSWALGGEGVEVFKRCKRRVKWSPC